MLPLLLAALAVKPTLDLVRQPSPATAIRACISPGVSAPTAPAPVKYTWVRSDKPSTATFTLSFTKAESLPVTYDWLLKGPADGVGSAAGDLSRSGPFRQGAIPSEMR